MQKRIISIQKKILTINILLPLLILFLGGCGRVDEAETDTEYDKPPVIELHDAADEDDIITVEPGGYTWNYLEQGKLPASCAARRVDPLTENAQWETLGMTWDMEYYTISVPEDVDELVINA